ncbi:MAG TPA: transglutaminaseTgpA domain-containing protein [Desulfomonilaceae bacterium]|nr:transglutaminaseTgpA domain-containing protein [Desulfomonilaceae bacterium]
MSTLHSIPALATRELIKYRIKELKQKSLTIRPTKAERSPALKNFLVALVGLSVAAACIENGLHPITLLALVPIWAALTRLDYGRPYIWTEKTITGLLLLYTAAVAIGMFLTQSHLVLPLFMVYFAFGTLMARVLSPLDNRAIAQLIFLTVSLILVNCILTNHLIFGLILPPYLFALMGTLLVFLLDESRRAHHDATGSLHQDFSLPSGLSRLVAKYSGFVFVLTIVTFAIIPRPFLIFPGLGAVTSAGGGFGDLQKYISYKQMANMGGRHRVAFFVHVERGSLPDYPYWRGRVLDRTDGNRWDSTRARGIIAGPVRAQSRETFVYRFVPYKLLSQTIYAAGLPLRAEGRMERPLYLNSRAEILVDTPFLLTDSYRITAVDRPLPAASKVDPINLDRAGVTSRIERLAREWTSGLTSPAEKAGTLARKLRTQFNYVLDNPSPPENVPPLEYFLFQSRSGNCEYFAGALCLMLRAIDIPARVVEGFAGVEPTDQAGQFLVRFSQGHAWVEAALGDGNWTALDPTPPGRAEAEASLLWRFLVDLYDAFEFRWNKYVVQFDRTDQMVMLKAFAGILFGEDSLPFSIEWKPSFILWVSGIGGALVLVGVLVRRGCNSRMAGPSRVYVQTMKHLHRKGILSRIDPWHENNLADIIRKSPRSQEALEKFMAIYFKARFREAGRMSLASLDTAGDELLQTIEHSISTRQNRLGFPFTRKSDKDF